MSDADPTTPTDAEAATMTRLGPARRLPDRRIPSRLRDDSPYAVIARCIGTAIPVRDSNAVLHLGRRPAKAASAVKGHGMRGRRFALKAPLDRGSRSGLPWI